MAKVCNICGYEPTKEQETDPTSPTENCPECGGLDSVVDDEAPSPEVGGSMEEEE